ncbi:probably inactive leucine-rich repeat receptor-like protein kinase [Tanacetum coccineum]
MEKFICRMSLEELNMATSSFDNKKVIGHGNMGIMYKAMFPSGLQLAVKRLHKFESFEKEFLLEIEILGRLRHINLVPLLGFCYEREKKFLVYKYTCNGTLHQWLHFRPQVESRKMGWPLRFKIAIGIARGLTWLHHNNVLRVVHLKISSRCILLDDKFEPKISNFGNSNILMNTSGIPSSGCTFVVPDASPSPYKEDVYKFGILLHELVTGREPSTWINSRSDHVCSRELIMIDESLMGQGFDEEIGETLKVAEKCIRAQTDGEIYMLQVYQEMHAIRISSNKISVDSCMNIEDN